MFWVIAAPRAVPSPVDSPRACQPVPGDPAHRRLGLIALLGTARPQNDMIERTRRLAERRRSGTRGPGRATKGFDPYHTARAPATHIAGYCLVRSGGGVWACPKSISGRTRSRGACAAGRQRKRDRANGFHRRSRHG